MQFLNLMPFPVSEYSSSSHTTSDGFVVETLESDAVEFDPLEHRAAHSESGVKWRACVVARRVRREALRPKPKPFIAQVQFVTSRVS